YPSDRPRGTSRAARTDPVAGREHGPRRDRWLREAPRDPRRRVSRAAQGQGPGARRGLLSSDPDPGTAGHRVRGAGAYPGRGEGHLQAAGRRDGGDHPQAAAARALQGQGDPLRGRVRAAQGGQAGMSVPTAPQRRLKRRRRVRAKVSGTESRPRISVFRSNRGLSAQLVDDSRGRTLAAVNWFEPDLRSLAKPERSKRAGELL